MTEQWTQIITLIVTNIVFTLTLWLWNRSESRSDITTMLSLIVTIKDEMKDFHGTLERQDAEFKSHLKYANHGKREGDK
jgi:hypothetical protein